MEHYFGGVFNLINLRVILTAATFSQEKPLSGDEFVKLIQFKYKP
jgi:hypothetical protein